MLKAVPRPAFATRLSSLARFWPAAALVALMAWAWRDVDFLHTLPAYGDTLEAMWALSWFGEAVRSGQNLTVYPLGFYPWGWHYAENLYLYLFLLPLQWLGGPAFTFNVVSLLTCPIAFAGTFFLSRRFLGRNIAAIAALLVTFSGVRWMHNIGHLNILVGSAMLPWILWSLDRALRVPKHTLRWLLLTGLLWAVAMSGSMYFAFLGGAAVLCWVGGSLLARTIKWRTAVVAAVVPAAVALLLSAPAMYYLYVTSVVQGDPYFSFTEVNFWGASLNNLPLPSLDHPWLGTLARRAYQGIAFEQGLANLGLLASLLALTGFFAAIRRRAWRPVQLLAAVTLVLALGLTLKWNNESLSLPWLSPVTSAIWRLGHQLKPAFFPQATPPAPFNTAIPMPGMLLAAIVPSIERARVFARFALVGSIGIAMLAGLALTLVRYRWLRLALAALLVIEVLPGPLPALPFAGVSHPAFEWLSQQQLHGGSVVDIVAGHPYTPVVNVVGETIWATTLHHQPTVSGASSVWPLRLGFLNDWLASHEHAFWNPNLAPILRFYNARFLLIYERGDWESGLVAEARQNPDLKFVDCFDPPAEGGVFPYPICIMQVLPAREPQKVNLVLDQGFSKQEDWGVWSEAASSEAFWVSLGKMDQVLGITVFPNCRPERKQKLRLAVNGVTVDTYDWPDCEPHDAKIVVPASLVNEGKNTLQLQADYALPPVDPNTGKETDTRPLSVGFTQLQATTP